MQERLSYKGMDVVIDYQDEDHAELSIDDRKIPVMRHGGALPMWACEHAYFMADDIDHLIRHLIDYWYVITDPSTAPPEGPGHGAMPAPEGTILPARGRALDARPDGDGGKDDDEDGHGHGRGGQSRRRGGRSGGGR
jgi:hypothetical protein